MCMFTHLLNVLTDYREILAKSKEIQWSNCPFISLKTVQGSSKNNRQIEIKLSKLLVSRLSNDSSSTLICRYKQKFFVCTRSSVVKLCGLIGFYIFFHSYKSYWPSGPSLLSVILAWILLIRPYFLKCNLKRFLCYKTCWNDINIIQNMKAAMYSC